MDFTICAHGSLQRQQKDQFEYEHVQQYGAIVLRKSLSELELSTETRKTLQVAVQQPTWHVSTILKHGDYEHSSSDVAVLTNLT